MTKQLFARVGVIAAGLTIAVAAFGSSPRHAEAASPSGEGAQCTSKTSGPGTMQYDENHILVCVAS
jgi:hypothetical protein